MTTSRQHCATLFTGCPCLSALRSKLRWWHTTISMADHSVLPRHLFTDRLCSLSFSASLCWQRWHDCTTYTRTARYGPRSFRVSAPQIRNMLPPHLKNTVVLVANNSSRALRLGSLCKPTHKRCLWELRLSGALQILDMIDWSLYIPVPVPIGVGSLRRPKA